MGSLLDVLLVVLDVVLFVFILFVLRHHGKQLEGAERVLSDLSIETDSVKASALDAHKRITRSNRRLDALAEILGHSWVATPERWEKKWTFPTEMVQGEKMTWGSSLKETLEKGEVACPVLKGGNCPHGVCPPKTEDEKNRAARGALSRVMAADVDVTQPKDYEVGEYKNTMGGH